MSQDLQPFDVVDGDLLDDTGPCDDQGASWCPGGPAPFTADPYDADIGNTNRLTFLHDSCAQLRADDI